MRSASLIIGGLALLLLAAFLAPVFKADPGYVLIRFQGWSLETTLLVLLAGLFLLYMLLRLVVWLWRWPLRSARKMREQSQRKQLEKGLLALAEGDFKAAEKALSKSASGEHATVALLGAARAAEGRSDSKAREGYLRQAEQGNKSNILVPLSRAEMLMAAENWSQALEILEELRDRYPRHQQVKAQAYHCYRQLGDWLKAGDLATELRKSGVIESAEEIACLQRSYQQRLSLAKDGPQLQQVWKMLPRTVRKNALVIASYTKLLSGLVGTDAAEAMLRKTLNQSWSEELIHQYALLDGGDKRGRLKQTEKWLQKYPEDAGVHLAIGRLCLAEKIWGKAREHLQTSLRYRPDRVTYATLGALSQRLGELEEAVDCFAKALQMCEKTVAEPSGAE